MSADRTTAAADGSRLAGTAAACAVLAGAAVPALVAGRAVLAILLLLALGCVPLMADRRAVAARAWGAMASPLGALIVLTFLAWLPSVVVSPAPGRSFEAALRTPLFVAAVTLVWAALAQARPRLDLALRTFLIAGIVFLAIAVAALTRWPELFGLLRLHGWTPLNVAVEIKDVASAGMLMVPVALWAGWRLGGGWRLASVVFVAGCLATIYFTYSRSAVAGLAAMTVAATLLWSSRPQRSPRVRIAALLATVAVIVGVLGWHHSMRTGSLAPEGWPIPTWIVDYTRQEIWANVWQAGEGRRVFGLGINTVNLRSGTEAIDPVTRIETIPAHPHNWAVEVLVETGIVGFVPFLLVVAVSVWRLMRGYHRTGDGAVLAALCVAAGYWSSGLFNFSYWSAWWQVGFLALTAFCLAGRAPPRDA